MPHRLTGNYFRLTGNCFGRTGNRRELPKPKQNRRCRNRVGGRGSDPKFGADHRCVIRENRWLSHRITVTRDCGEKAAGPSNQIRRRGGSDNGSVGSPHQVREACSRHRHCQSRSRLCRRGWQGSARLGSTRASIDGATRAISPGPRLHPLQSGQARVRAAGAGLALFVFPSPGAARRLSREPGGRHGRTTYARSAREDGFRYAVRQEIQRLVIPGRGLLPASRNDSF
jgi:hypothetical protein